MCEGRRGAAIGDAIFQGSHGRTFLHFGAEGGGGGLRWWAPSSTVASGNIPRVWIMLSKHGNHFTVFLERGKYRKPVVNDR